MDNVLVTGATGFIGKALCAELIVNGFVVHAVVRDLGSAALSPSAKPVVIGGLDADTEWRQALLCIDVVVHLAARVHVMVDTDTDPLAAFRKVNVAATLNLARQAAAAGVKRFVFISSIKVNGEQTVPGLVFSADDEPAPVDAYAISKLEAETGLRQLALATAMEVVIIRPPLVYGPGVKANFKTMMRYLDKGVPLPLGAIVNKRSLVTLDNLVDVIMVCMAHPAAANQTFLVSDGEDVSTPELLHRLARAMGKTARLLPVHILLLQGMLFLAGKRRLAQRLCGNLQMDISKTRELLAWSPRTGLDDALYQTAQYYLISR